MSERAHILAVAPSLRISGGIKELVRLLQQLRADQRIEVTILSMWKHSHEVDTGGIPVVHLLQAEPVGARALMQMPRILFAFRQLLATMRSIPHRRLHLMLSHYSTYPLAWTAPSLPRICFDQDMEWLFVPEGWRRSLLKRAILLTNRRSSAITTNAFVTESYRSEGVVPVGEASIWAERRWLVADVPSARDIDVLVLLRGSRIKRLDLYREALHAFRARTSLRVVAITPDTAIANELSSQVSEMHLRPSDGAMQELFGRSRVFLLLSDVEGFGLPPLEAMGSGCVPVCRDSGGVRCYMHGIFRDFLFDRNVPVAHIVDEIAARLATQSLPSPEAAQQAFEAGYKAGLARRSECIRRVQQQLLGDAP